MKEQHIKWASQHDWYIGHGLNVENKLFIRVIERYSDGTEFGHTYHNFTNPQSLREWAGY